MGCRQRSGNRGRTLVYTILTVLILTFSVSAAGNFKIENETHTDLFYISGTTGNVGVGTETPTTKFDVLGDANFSGSVYISDTLVVPGASLSENISGDRLALNTNVLSQLGSLVATDGTRSVQLANGIAAGNFTSGSSTVKLAQGGTAGSFTGGGTSATLADGTNAGYYSAGSMAATLAVDGILAGHFTDGTSEVYMPYGPAALFSDDGSSHWAELSTGNGDVAGYFYSLSNEVKVGGDSYALIANDSTDLVYLLDGSQGLYVDTSGSGNPAGIFVDVDGNTAELASAAYAVYGNKGVAGIAAGNFGDGTRTVSLADGTNAISATGISDLNGAVDIDTGGSAVTIDGGLLNVGTGTNTHSMGANDALFGGNVEIDGNLYVDGNVDIDGVIFGGGNIQISENLTAKNINFTDDMFPGGNVCGANEIPMKVGGVWTCTVEIGDIEGVTAGAGLTGTATSGTPTIDVGEAAGIVVAADTVGVDYTPTTGTALLDWVDDALTISTAAAGNALYGGANEPLGVNDGYGLFVSSDQLHVGAGDGLWPAPNAIHVGAGTGISVGTDSISATLGTTITSNEIVDDNVKPVDLDDGTDTAAINNVVMIDNADTTQFAYIGIPDCDDGSGHLNYDVTTQTFTCGTTDDTGGSMSSFTVAGTTGTPQTISEGDTLTIREGNGIVTTGTATDYLDVAVDYTPSSGTATIGWSNDALVVATAAAGNALYGGGTAPLHVNPGGGLFILNDKIHVGQGTGVVVDADTIRTTLGTSIETGEITDDTISEADLDMVDTAADEAILTYESGAGGSFEWHTGAELCVAITGSAALCDGDDAAGSGASNTFETINAPSGTDPVAESSTDTLNLAASGIVTISGDSTTDTITIGATEVGDISGVTAGDGLTGGGSSGSVTLNVGAGTGISVAADNISATLGTSITTGEIVDGTISEADLKVVDSPADENILTYETTTGDFEWHTGPELCVAITGSADLCDGTDDAGTGGAAYAFRYIRNNTGSQAIADSASDTFTLTGYGAADVACNDAGDECQIIVQEMDDSNTNELQNIWKKIWTSSGTHPIPDNTGDELKLIGVAPIYVTGNSITDTVYFSVGNNNRISGVSPGKGIKGGGTYGGVSVDLDDTGCAAYEVLKRNAGNTDWECVPDTGGVDTTCDGGTCNIANTGTLDGLNAADFLRSNAADFFTGTYIDIANNVWFGLSSTGGRISWYDSTTDEIQILDASLCVNAYGGGACSGDTAGDLVVADGGICAGDGNDCPAMADGVIRYDTSQSAYDVAEYYYTDQRLEEGDVVVITGNITVDKSEKPYDSRVMGVVSTNPNIVFGVKVDMTYSGLGGNEAPIEDNRAAIALIGRVPTKASNENGEIQPGDLLTTSTKSGHAMKFTALDALEAKDWEELKLILAENERRRNTIVGKALEECDQEICLIQTFINLA